MSAYYVQGALLGSMNSREVNTTLALTSRKGEDSKIAIIQGRKEIVSEEMEKEDAVW